MHLKTGRKIIARYVTMFLGHAVPIIRALKMDAAGSFETVPAYEITRRNIPDDSRPNFHVHRRENWFV
jgi:hypothetical protein